VGVDAGSVASVLATSWELLADVLDGGSWERRPGAIAAVTGVTEAILNPVLVLDAHADLRAVGELIERAASRGLPYCVQCRPELRGSLGAVVAAHRMQTGEDLPLMVLEQARGAKLAPVARLSLRRLRPEESALHARVAAAGFEAPADIFEQLVPPSLLARKEVRCYVGEADGDSVTTALSVTVEGSIGIFNVATPPDSRGRGYGSAVTAHAVLDAAGADATWAWLQSSPSGVSVYEGLGFRTLERWPCWVSG
jgi:predicted GNAT family acetyltransferase